jgi:rhomboid protease GluP
MVQLAETRRMCPHCRAFITTRDRVCPYCDTEVGPRASERREPGSVAGGLVPHGRFVTMLILTVNIGLFIATMLYSMRAGNESLMDIDGQTLFQFGAKYRDAILLGQWWRLITAGFLHGGLFHILMNSWVLFDVGAQIEEVFGARRFIAIYFVSTVLGFFASTWWSPALSIGASAGIFGLIGAMIAFGTTAGTSMGAAVRGMYIRWAIYGFLIGLLPFFQVDNAAHLGGLAGGFVTAYIAGQPRPGALPEKIWGAVAGVSIAITAYAFLLMFLWFSSSNA